jgi:hypothetical protein
MRQMRSKALVVGGWPLAMCLSAAGCGESEQVPTDPPLPRETNAADRPSPEETNAAREQPSATITGELSYPSDYIPPDMVVCAEDIATGNPSCDSRTYEEAGRRFYRLSVPAGRYRVYARTGDMPDYRAYYSQAVPCGLHAGCPSHEPIVVTIGPGETRESVNPHDWYAPNAR